MTYEFLLVLAIILLSTKLFGLLSERVRMPQVVGALLAGIVLGPSVLGLVQETDFLVKSAEIGVVLLMFTAGLETDLDELKKTGAASFVIALIGVLVPLAGGAAVYELFFRDTSDPNDFLKAVFIGVVLTATSVSITVETLRELGRLKGKIGTAILGAAVIDDVLGIIVLTVCTGFTDPSVKPLTVFGSIFLFFVFLAVVAVIMHYIFARMEGAWDHHRRLPIYAVAFCFILSFVAETYFGIADITGAYFAGLILCNILGLREYVSEKVGIMSYMLFSPLFFASIGIKTTLDGMTFQIAMFSLALLVVAVLSKVIGCGLGARVCGFGNYESLCVGIGMISRGEVALIVAQKGAAAGLIDTRLFPAIVIVVVVTTLITPVLLKAVMHRPASSDSALHPQTSHS